MSLSLRLFGAPGVDGPDGPLGGRIAQRHPLALLAVLATAPSATVSREKLLGLLWPDSDTDHARGLLNVALHAIRKALGEGAIVSVGGSLQLDEAAVRSDVRAFSDALAQGEPERAVEAYTGPFLDGFYLDVEAFDGWADGERARLAGLLGEAMERLAEAAERAGDPVRAGAWWKRRAGHEPCDSRVALRLMEALAAAGDRAGAIQHARVHEALLRESLGAAPSPEVSALAERLRTEPAPSTPAPGVEAPEVSAAEAAAPAEPVPVHHPRALGSEQRDPGPAAPAVSAAVRGDGALQRPSSTGTSLRRRRRWRRHGWPATIARAVLLLLIGGAAAALWRGVGRIQFYSLSAAEALPRGPVVAVLPFTDRGPGGESGALGDGISEEIITALARLPTLRVVARTSAFAFRDSALDMRVIGARLDAGYVLEGSVASVGGRLRIHALLVNVDDGMQVWSGSYDREPQALFAVQDEIARGIVHALRPRLMLSRELVRRPTENMEAYNLYIQGRQASSRRTLDGLTRAIELMQRAAARDGSFAEAYARLAECHTLLVSYGAVSPREGYPLARAAAERALMLDRSLAEAHAALALVRMHFERDWPAARREFETALDQRPNYATARHWYATYLSYQGRHDDAIAEIREAQLLDPLSPVVHTGGSTILYYAQRYDESINQARAALLIDPGFWLAHLQMAAALAQQRRYPEAVVAVERARSLSHGHPLPETVRGYILAVSGRPDEAREVIRQLEAQQGQRYVSPAYMAAIYTGLGDADAALQWLEHAYEAADDWAVYMEVEPVFEPLRDDPRFIQLLRRVEHGVKVTSARR